MAESRKPVVPRGEKEIKALLIAAADGDPSALPAVRELLRDNPAFKDFIASVEVQAAGVLIQTVAGLNNVWAEAIREKLTERIDQLVAEFGPSPPLVARMAATRAAHAWLAIHALESRGATERPGNRMALAIEKQLSMAERRLALALRTLALLRRLQQPTVLAQVNVAKRMQVNNPAPALTS